MEEFMNFVEINGQVFAVSDDVLLKLQTEKEYTEIFLKENDPVPLESANVTYNTETEKPKCANEDDGVNHWSKEKCKALLTIRLEMEPEFQDKTCKAIKLWNKVAQKMVNAGFSCTGTECSEKFKMFKGIYTKYKKQAQTSGEASRKWEYHTAFNNVFGNRQSIQPNKEFLGSTEDEESPSTSEVETSGTAEKSEKRAQKRNWLQAFLAERTVVEDQRAEREEERNKKIEIFLEQKQKTEQEKLNIQKELLELMKTVFTHDK